MLQNLKLQVKTKTSEKHLYEKPTIMVIKKTSNFAFICRKVYITRLSAEIGFLKDPNGTYKQRDNLKEETMKNDKKCFQKCSECLICKNKELVKDLLRHLKMVFKRKMIRKMINVFSCITSVQYTLSGHIKILPIPCLKLLILFL